MLKNLIVRLFLIIADMTFPFILTISTIAGLASFRPGHAGITALEASAAYILIAMLSLVVLRGNEELEPRAHMIVAIRIALGGLSFLIALWIMYGIYFLFLTTTSP